MRTRRRDEASLSKTTIGDPLYVYLVRSDYVSNPLISTAMTTGVGRARCDAHNFRRKPENPKTDHPKKVDFGPFSTPLYRPIRTVFRDGAKMVIFEGSRPQNRKKAFFCKKT